MSLRSWLGLGSGAPKSGEAASQRKPSLKETLSDDEYHRRRKEASIRVLKLCFQFINARRQEFIDRLLDGSEEIELLRLSYIHWDEQPYPAHIQVDLAGLTSAIPWVKIWCYLYGSGKGVEISEDAIDRMWPWLPKVTQTTLEQLEAADESAIQRWVYLNHRPELIAGRAPEGTGTELASAMSPAGNGKELIPAVGQPEVVLRR